MADSISHPHLENSLASVASVQDVMGFLSFVPTKWWHFTRTLGLYYFRIELILSHSWHIQFKVGKAPVDNRVALQMKAVIYIIWIWEQTAICRKYALVIMLSHSTVCTFTFREKWHPSCQRILQPDRPRGCIIPSYPLLPITEIVY